jgi:MSHA pilin protein MshD
MKCDGQVMHAFRPRRNGLAMVEIVVSIAIVGVMMVAALNTVGASRLGQKKTGDRGKGALLAQQLMSEILRQYYVEPVDTPSFGRESSESGGGRADYDDVDDYDAWTASPPQNKDGTAIPDLNGWRRSVEVDWVAPDDLTTPIGVDESVKRIIVMVSRQGVPVASLTAVRTASGQIDREP